MVSLDDLRQIYLLANLPESMMQELASLVQLRIFSENATIYREGEEAQDFYMLLKGKVLLEREASPSIMVSLGAVKSGFSFGWSALLPGWSYTTIAISAEPCEILTIPGRDILRVLEENHSIGYRFLTEVVKIYHRRLHRRTDQFLKALREHPDMERLFRE